MEEAQDSLYGGPELSTEEQATYAWQMDLPGFGIAGQRRLKGATVFISRAGGLGGPAAMALAGAGVGRLIIAHAGVVLPADLNRQVLQTHARIGLPRGEQIRATLLAYNPRLQVDIIPCHAAPDNADALIRGADLVIDAAPLFSERFALNDACVRARIPMVEAAMHHWEAQVTTVLPGSGPCVRCWCPEAPDWWTRRFPVLGAVSATAGNIAACEAVKLITGLGVPLVGRRLIMDLGQGSLRILKTRRDPACPLCAGITVPG